MQDKVFELEHQMIKIKIKDRESNNKDLSAYMGVQYGKGIQVVHETRGVGIETKLTVRKI